MRYTVECCFVKRLLPTFVNIGPHLLLMSETLYFLSECGMFAAFVSLECCVSCTRHAALLSFDTVNN